MNYFFLMLKKYGEEKHIFNEFTILFMQSFIYLFILFGGGRGEMINLNVDINMFVKI